MLHGYMDPLGLNMHHYHVLMRRVCSGSRGIAVRQLIVFDNFLQPETRPSNAVFEHLLAAVSSLCAQGQEAHPTSLVEDSS